MGGVRSLSSLKYGSKKVFCLPKTLVAVCIRIFSVRVVHTWRVDNEVWNQQLLPWTRHAKH